MSDNSDYQTGWEHAKEEYEPKLSAAQARIKEQEEDCNNHTWEWEKESRELRDKISALEASLAMATKDCQVMYRVFKDLRAIVKSHSEENLGPIRIEQLVAIFCSMRDYEPASIQAAKIGELNEETH